MKKCWICGKFVNIEDHRCFIQPELKKRKERGRSEGEDEESNGFFDTECRIDHHEDDDESVEETLTDLLFFDFECRQKNGTHEPNLCIVQNEAGDEWIFQGDTTQKNFCDWLFTDEHIGCTAMAHNFQGYDSYFILQYLREQGVMYEVIMRGGKTLSLKVPMFNIKFIDSLNFIPMKLANFPKTFGIEELAKGYFPHLFNKKENETYIGPILRMPYYNLNGMSPKDRETFMTWHASLIAHKWLSYLSEKNDVYIQHARDGGKKRVGKYSLDGYCEEIHTAFEFHGCFWHGEFSLSLYYRVQIHAKTFLFIGCPKCYARDTVNPVNRNTMDEFYQATVEKTEYLKCNGYNVVEMWECNMKQELEEDEAMKHYFDHYHLTDPLEPRDALYGGRTNASKLYHCCEGDEQIKCVDFTSLYPHVNRSKTVPTWHPEIIAENFGEDVSNYFGLIKCTVLPPRALFRPVLPSRTQGKLIFALCKRCADSRARIPTPNAPFKERVVPSSWKKR